MGKGTGVDIVIRDDQGEPLPTGKQGEVTIRGVNVMHGYLNNPEANATAFWDGYFRTGDQGVLDEIDMTLAQQVPTLVEMSAKAASMPPSAPKGQA